MGLKNKPTNNPMAPKISNIIINRPNLSNLKRLNSFFIWGEMKQLIVQNKKDKLDIKTEEISKKLFIVKLYYLKLM